MSIQHDVMPGAPRLAPAPQKRATVNQTMPQAVGLKNRSLFDRAGFAVAGVIGTWLREKSFRTQTLVSVAAIGLVILLRPGLMWDAVAALAIALVLALELVNSAIEALADYVQPGYAREIKIVKDTASGAVLLATIGAGAVAVFMVAHVLFE